MAPDACAPASSRVSVLCVLQASEPRARPGRQEHGPVSGADAGRAAAGAAGIVSAFILAQIFTRALLPAHPPRPPGPSLSATGSLTEGSSAVILYICK